MEDVIVVEEQIGDDASCFLFAVFDGHGGIEIAQLASKMLVEQLNKAELSRISDLEQCLKQIFI